MTAESEPAQPAGGMAPPNPDMEDAFKLIADFLASPEFKDLNSFEPCSSFVDMEELLTTPLNQCFVHPLDDFSSSSEQQHLTSPISAVLGLLPDVYNESPFGESPFEDFIKTPVFLNSEMLSDFMEDMEFNSDPLFNDLATALLKQAEQAKPADVPLHPDFDSTYEVALLEDLRMGLQLASISDHKRNV